MTSEVDRARLVPSTLESPEVFKKGVEMASSSKKIRTEILNTLRRKKGHVAAPDGANVVPVLMSNCRGGAIGNRVQWSEALEQMEARGDVQVVRHGGVPIAVSA